ncbi:antitoxin HicB [Pseudoxanthobacter soli DSM 19599]|uniref:Antitoxin HicB n=2 Tax=Pseudoxanthobacter TaxID=433838 RepID=A0A1M7ZQF5_9HYPH|nr:antitoxin HicB [Pseudoxanthobacter soli DSM 19599]
MQPAFAYPVAFARGPSGKIEVSARDVPPLITSGDSEAAAIAQAIDGLGAALATYVFDGADFPVPSAPLPGERLVAPPPLAAAKFAVIAAWRAADISKTELAARLGLAEGEVRRILDPRHSTKLDRLAAVAEALGKRLVVGIEEL